MWLLLCDGGVGETGGGVDRWRWEDGEGVRSVVDSYLVAVVAASERSQHRRAYSNYSLGEQ